jgi:Skp family chaperone for outer membrane proteins
MGQEEEDAIVGRLYRESGEAKRASVAIEEKFNKVKEGIGQLLKDLDRMRSQELYTNHGSLSEYLRLDALKALIEQREDARRRAEEFARRVKDLGG